MEIISKKPQKVSIVCFIILVLTTIFPLSIFASEKTVTNSLGMEFVLIPAGSFVMGSPLHETNWDASEIQHEVTISKPFYIQATEVTMKQAPMLTEKLDQLNLPEEETGRLMMTFVRGMLFLQILEARSEFQYSGNGVKLGDAEKAIFWYQPKGSETYRIIYGDLSVKDVSAEELPK